MHTEIRNHLDPFIDKIETREKLTEEERDALRALPQKVVRTTGRTRIVEEGERPTHACMVLEGMVYRTKLAATGRRQIMSFHVPGDMVDLHTILFKIADHSIESVRSATIVMIRHEVVLKAAERWPALARAFWYDTLVDASIQREAQLNIGRRDARTRTAHLLCELLLRMRRVGMADGFTIDMPLTQTDLADALGITPIHINRVLAKLRAEGLITLDARTLTIHNWQRLVDIGEFDPLYLHMEGIKDLHI
jgi:CRP-like cAMP-binding protein